MKTKELIKQARRAQQLDGLAYAQVCALIAIAQGINELNCGHLYYFEIEKRKDNSLTFAYVYRVGDDASTTPPVKEFHSSLACDEAKNAVRILAAKWIRDHGKFA